MSVAPSKLDVVASGPFTIPINSPPPNSVEQSIVNAVAYADIFDFPLTSAEIQRYLTGMLLSQTDLTAELQRTLDHSTRLAQSDGYTYLHGRTNLVAIRRERQALSEGLWIDAVRYGGLIAQLPFVRMVAVTGSLAVNNVGEHKDIDYFIVTANDYLWITRAMTIAIVRLAAQRGVWLCPNYFLSERALAISDQTLYTAHEVTQMVPLAGRAMYDAFRAANRWTDSFLPNAVEPPPSSALFVNEDKLSNANPLTQTSEWLLRTPPGQRLNAWEMERKIRKLSQAHQGSRETSYTADWCKGHFSSHQDRTLHAYQTRLNDAPNATRL